MSYLDHELMRRSGRILGEALRFLESDYIVPGMSSLEISKKAEEIIRSHAGAVPAFIGYNGFPEAACVSINCEAVHAIPTEYSIVKEGDIVSVDLGVELEGHFTDACRTIGVGEVSPRVQSLIDTTREALKKGIERAVVGNRIGDISYNIQRHVERNGFTVSLELVGHGIGRVLHGPPCVPNYGPPGRGIILEKGQCLALEPVVFDGSSEVVLSDDGWTLYSKYSNLSAHFEDTIIITSQGPEVIT